MAKQSAQRAMMNPERAVGSNSTPSSGTIESDETYGIVSVLYHALEGAQTYTRYIDDAKRNGDEALAEFLEDCRDELTEQAERARSMLLERLDDAAEDDVESDDE